MKSVLASVLFFWTVVVGFAGTISTGTKPALGNICQLKSGKLIILYPNGSVRHARGDIAFRVSGDAGKSWGPETVAISGGSNDLYNISAGVTSSGRLIVAYHKESPPVDSGIQLGLFYAHSDDEGVSWSPEIQIGSDVTEYGYGQIIQIGEGKILIPSYSYTFRPNESARPYVRISSDDGVTLGAPIPVLPTGLYNEPSMVCLGAGQIVGLVRVINGSAFRQVASVDNGESWIDQGETDFETWTAGTNIESPAWLSTFNSGRMVAAYFVNRETHKLRVIYGSASELISKGVAGWRVETLRTISNANAVDDPYAAGYPTAVHPFDGAYSLGWFYDSAGGRERQITFFKNLPAARLGLRLEIIGEPGPDYTIQSSTDLTSWTTFDGANAPAGDRFYRLLIE